MKKIFSISLFMFLGVLFVNGQSWYWRSEVSNNNSESGIFSYASAVDNSGNIYVTGSFEDTIIFNSYILDFGGGFCVNHVSTFLAKYKPDGSLAWAKQVSKLQPNVNSGCTAQSITIDNSGNIYLVGQYTDTVTIGSSIMIAKDIGASIYPCAFIVKLDSTGNVLWINNSYSPSTGYMYTSSVTVDNNNNVYIAGQFSGKNFLSNDSILSIPEIEFIAKYHSNGTLDWLKQTSNESESLMSPSSIVFSAVGNGIIYISGAFEHSAILGNDTLKGSTNYGTYCYLARMDTAGNFIWAKQSTEPTLNNYSSGWISSTTCDNEGNAYITGTFGDTILFGGFQFISPPSGFQSMFVAKYDKLGNVKWAKGCTGNGLVSATYLCHDDRDNIYLSGSVRQDTMTFGSFTDIANVDSSYYSAFLMDLDTSGNVICGSTELGENPYVACDTSGQYVCLAEYDNDMGMGILRWGTCSNVTGISKIEEKQNTVVVYPNPSSGLFTFSFSNPELISGSQLRIYNIMGEQVYNVILSQAQQNLKVDLSNNSVGIYLYRIDSENKKEISSGKLIVH